MSDPAPIAGIVERVIFANATTGYAVLRVRPEGSVDPIVLVGDAAAAQAGDAIRAEGTWHDDPSWGRQFRAASLTLQPTTSPQGLQAYLGSGVVKGIGPAIAAKLVARFGEALPDVMTREPQRLAEVDGVGDALAQRIHDAWEEQRGRRDLLVFLQGHGLGPGRAARVLESWGGDAVARITADPYALAREVPGLGFKQADLLASRLGIAGDAPIRLAAAVLHVLAEHTAEGHAAAAREALVAGITALTGVTDAAADDAIDRLAADGKLVLDSDEDGPLVFPLALARAERRIAERLAAMADARPIWRIADPEGAVAEAGEALGIELAPAQRDAVRTALERRVLVVTGGPGTGKTTLLRALLAALEPVRPAVALAAPTGRAARRMTESTGVDARTLHRLLEADPGRGFARNAQRPLTCDLLVVDEASMLDLVLADAVLDALPQHAALLLVGDVDQLPSIGPGQVLADVIASGVVPVVRLDEIFRQAATSRIVTNAHHVNRGEPLELARPDDAIVDFYAVRARDPEDAADKVVELVARRIPERFAADPIDEIQVLAPTHRGHTGTRELNRRLQATLNPSTPVKLERKGVVLAQGDKVMQTENDYEREVSNGDVGRIVRLDPKGPQVDVAFEQRRVAYAGEAVDALAPAYAITVHKAQGSEYPVVVMPLSREHGRMLRRDLLYTAITRARRLVVLVAEPDALERALGSARARNRRSLLRRRLVECSLEAGPQPGPQVSPPPDQEPAPP